MKILQTSNLGKGYADRTSDIRYSIYNTLGTETTSATNTGVYQLGTSTGLYGVELNLNNRFSGSIVWSVDGNTNVYATEEIKMDQKMARFIHTGRWIIDENTNQMVFYEDDNVTEIARYDLKDRDGNPSIDEIFERTRVI